MWAYNYSTELCHHGIKGMKWGVRRYQNKDGSLTIAGKKQKKQLSTKNKIAIAAGVTVAAATVVAGAYFTHRYLQMNADTVIKAGKEFQHMGRTGEDLTKTFYASHLKRDNKIYAKNDFIGSHWKTQKILTSNKDIRVAGKKASLDAFMEWSKNSPAAKEYMDTRFGNIDVSSKSKARSAYYKFNRQLASPDMNDKKAFNDFYSFLQKKGYSAIRDMNDQVNTGTRSPLIIFGNLQDIMTKKVIDLS